MSAKTIRFRKTLCRIAAMKPNPKAQDFFDSPFARCENRLEKADIELFPEPSIQAYAEKALSIAPGTFRA
jgi:hypothetical protein